MILGDDFLGINFENKDKGAFKGTFGNVLSH